MRPPAWGPNGEEGRGATDPMAGESPQVGIYIPLLRPETLQQITRTTKTQRPRPKDRIGLEATPGRPETRPKMAEEPPHSPQAKAWPDPQTLPSALPLTYLVSAMRCRSAFT